MKYLIILLIFVSFQAIGQSRSPSNDDNIITLNTNRQNYDEFFNGVLKHISKAGFKANYINKEAGIIQTDYSPTNAGLISLNIVVEDGGVSRTAYITASKQTAKARLFLLIVSVEFNNRKRVSYSTAEGGDKSFNYVSDLMKSYENSTIYYHRN